MDLFHEKSDPLSSQPTQLLQHALAPDSIPESQEHSKDWGLAPPEDKGNATKDFSLDSMIIPARASTPHYHLQDSLAQSPGGHGQHMFMAAEGSQKENVIPVSCRDNRQLENSAGTAGSLSPPSLDNVAAQGSSSEAFNQRQHGDSTLSASTGKVIGARTTTFQSPTTTGPRPVPRATKSMPVGSRYYPRSPSPPSQDSFGGSVSQDPADKYLASTNQFNVPLSALGETPTQEAINPEPEPGLTLPDASEHKEFLEAAMREYEAQRANRTSNVNRHGNILVAATPSNSDESLGTSRHKDDGFSFHNLATDNQESRYDFDGASSFDKMLDRDLADGPEPTPEPTQPDELDLTQVDDPVPLDLPASPVMPPQSGNQLPPSFQWVAPSPSAAVTPSNPRSLLSMVHPKNQYRIAMMRNRGAGEATQPSRVQETQPSHVEETFRPNSPPPPPPPAPKAPSHRGHGYQPHTDLDPDDALDVVPDSEPLRAGPSAPTPSHRRGATQSPLKHSVRPPSPMSDQEPGDLSGSFEESEVDIPLAIEVASRGTRESPVTAGVKSAPNRKPRPAVPAAPKVPSAINGQAGKPASATVKGKNSKAKSEPTAIPTSLPEQDLAPSSGQSSMPTAKRRGRKSLPQEPPRARATPATGRSAAKAVAGKKRSYSSDTESSEERSHQPTEDKDNRNRLPQPQEEEEESEDDHAHDMHVDSPPPPPVKPEPSRKKRRTEDETKPLRGMSKASATTTRGKRSETPVAAAARSAKWLRSAGQSSIRGPTSESATRVFALWKKDGHYYSGVVHSLQSKNNYIVKFDDEDDDVVEVKNMRRHELMVGDRVIQNHENVKGTVKDVSQMDPHGSFTFEIDDGGRTSTMPLAAKDIRIATRTIQSQWKDRTVTAETIVTVVKPKSVLGTASSGKSLLGVASADAREFSKTGFVFTLGTKNEDPIRTKATVMSGIKRHGGLVIEDWSNVFAMEGKHSHSNKRWVATQKDFHWKRNANLDRVFLLSDDAHQKPKFLLALALGIPCLSFEWLTNEGTFSSDWQPFLLPAGYSDILHARMSQLVDLDWGNCIEHLTEIMDNRVAPKLLWEKTVLCVGVDLVPLPPTRAKKTMSEAERSREAAQYVPWIILCMGAAKVEAVTDIKQVSLEHMRTFDYIVVRQYLDDLGSTVDDLRNEVFFGNVKWIKECLTCSRITEPAWEEK